MARTGLRTAAWVLLAIVAAAVGYRVGVSRQIEATIQMLQVNAAGNLVQRIETLSLIRVGDVAGVIDRLESEADTLTVRMAANSGADQGAIAYMKTYLSVAPPSPEREQALAAALADVPVLRPGECNTGLKALLLSAKASN